jgi:hypothetical protein
MLSSESTCGAAEPRSCIAASAIHGTRMVHYSTTAGLSMASVASRATPSWRLADAAAGAMFISYGAHCALGVAAPFAVARGCILAVAAQQAGSLQRDQVSQSMCAHLICCYRRSAAQPLCPACDLHDAASLMLHSTHARPRSASASSSRDNLKPDVRSTGRQDFTGTKWQ